MPAQVRQPTAGIPLNHCVLLVSCITYNMGLIIVSTSLGFLYRLNELIHVKFLAQCMPENVCSIIIIICSSSFVSLPLNSWLEEFVSSKGKTLFAKEMGKNTEETDTLTSEEIHGASQIMIAKGSSGSVQG